jgi:hypothetical protein
MLDHWFQTIKLPLSWRQFLQLPQDAAYKYEYSDETAWLTPRPKFYHARLRLRRQGDALPLEVEAKSPVRFRSLQEHDWPRLSRTFAASFRRVQPFASLSDRRRVEAARECLKHTHSGGEGPVIAPACHVAWDEENGRPAGAIVVTLIPAVDLEGFWDARWPSPPPPDCIERRLGRPHLTWVFVGPWHAGHGVGSALLAHASQKLIDLGYTELISSFILGNTSSMLWHWRSGFELLAYDGSIRQFRARMREAHASAQSSTPT